MTTPYIYHLVQETLWKKAGASDYLPPTYESDGFIHATKEAELLIPVANHFYREVKGAFLCLRIDTGLLKSAVKYEPAASVGIKEAPTSDVIETEEESNPPAADRLFPHIYGPINPEAVTDELVVNRTKEGNFLSIVDLS